MAEAPAKKPAPDLVGASVSDLLAVIKRLGRDDLERRTTAAAARLKRTSTIVCVVGEFKQGKSSLLNGLLGRSLLPVDDDLATSTITLVAHGAEPSAIVRRRVDGDLVKEPIAVESLADWSSEIGNAGNHKGVERVEVKSPGKILEQGVTLVDTPGMGGLGAGHAAATQAFLPFADGLILVSDSSSELSAPEVSFMKSAIDLCPTVLFVQTKTDLYPNWGRIFELNRGHLDRTGIKVPMLAVSASLRMEALARKDRGLNDGSGYGQLINNLVEKVINPAKASARERSVADVKGVAGLLRSAVTEERASLSNPEERERALARLQEANQRLEHLRGPGAKWSTRLNDGISDLSSSVTHGMRGSFRELTQQMEDRVQTIKTGGHWDEMSRDLQTGVAAIVTEAFRSVLDGSADLRTELAQLVDDEGLQVGDGASRLAAFDVTEFWQDKGLDAGTDATAKKAFQTGLTGLRGAQSGVMMFGMMGRFLPAAAGTLLAANPVLLTAGAAFGTFQLMEDRKRKLTAKRQSARTQVRQFVDNTQFEVSNEVTSMIKEVQRELRDDFSENLGQLQRGYADTIKQIQKSQQASDADRKKRLEQVGVLMKALDGVDARLKAVG